MDGLKKGNASACAWRRLVLLCVCILLGAGVLQPATAKLVADPADGYSMPAEFQPRDFYTLSRLFYQPGNSVAMGDTFSVADLDCVQRDGQEWVRWHFNKKIDSALPSLGYHYPSRIAPTGFSVRVRNMAQTPVALSGWGETEAKNFKTLQPGEEALVRFNGQPSLVAQGTKSGQDCDLYLRELTLYFPEAEGLTAPVLEAPAQLVAGQPAEFKLAIQGNLEKKVVDLEVRQDPWVVWRIRLTPEELKEVGAGKPITLARPVPAYLSPGAVTLGLVADGRRIHGEPAQATVINDRHAELAKVERRVDHGRPTFFVDGQPFAWHGYATYNFFPGAVNEFLGSNANLVHITCAPGRHYHNVSAPTWLGGDEYDFGEIEQMVTTALQANPDAKLIMRLALGLPPTWYNEHPDSLVRAQSTSGREMVWRETDSLVGSLTSEEWRQQQAIALRKMIQYLASRPWADHVIGFNIGGAMTEEWFAWASCAEIIKPVEYFSDYSPANQAAFKKWCAAKGYPYDRIPPANLRNKPDYELFPDDDNGRWAAAYNLFINEVSAETIQYFASVIKDETKRRSLVGVFYGYVVLLTGEARQSDAGQFGLRQILESEDVDFLGGVPQHLLRSLTGIGYGHQATAESSVLAHGKQYMDDNDLFSWLHPKAWAVNYDDKDPCGALIKMHRRWTALEAVLGNSYEWFSLEPTWHHDERVMDEFALEARIHGESLSMDRTPAEEIAFVIDDYTFAWLTPTAKAHLTNQMLLGAMGRTGAPMGTWVLSDLDRLPDRIKFVVIVNAAAPRADDLEKMRRLIERGGRTILVVGTPGLIDSATLRWNPANVESVLGLPIRLDPEAQPARACLAESGECISPIQISEKEPALIRPRAYAEGKGFMKYDDGKAAGVERPLANGGRLIWCGVAPFDNVAWLRAQVQAAGVHCYAPAPCSVHASADLVSVTSVYADDRDVELTWPQAVTVTDLFDGWSGQGQTMTCPFTHGQTRLFKVTRP